MDSWVIVHQSQILYRGSRQRCADVAEAHRFAPRIVTSASDLDRGIARGPILMPAVMLPERLRRRAA